MALVEAADVRRALDALDAEDAARSARIDALLARAADTLTHTDADAARAVQPQLARVAHDADDVAARLHTTAATAAQLHADLHDIHEERTRVKQAIDWCRAVIDVKEACAALADALDRHDWDAAATHCAAALAVDPAVVHSTFAQHTAPTAALPEDAPHTIAALRMRLLMALRTQFVHYTMEDRDEAQATRFLSLFSVVKAHDEGIAAYTALATQIVHAQGKPIQEKLLASPPAAPYYSALWAALFDNLAVFIHEHQPVVDRLFHAEEHPGFVQGVLPGLSAEWTRLGTQVLDVLDERRTRARLVKACASARFTVVDAVRATPYTPGRIFGSDDAQGKDRAMPFALTRPSTPSVPSAPPAPDGPDAGVIDVLLTELAHISAQWALFVQFLHNALHTSPAELDAAAHRDARASLVPRIEALRMDAYLPLQRYALRAGLEKAHALDTADLEARPVTSSMPDDLFFVVRTVLTRTLSTSSVSVVERIVDDVLALLDTEYADVVVLRVDSCRRTLNVPRLVEGPRRIAAAREVKMTMAVYLNVLDVSAAYMERMLQDLQDRAFLAQYYSEQPAGDDADVSATSELATVQDTLSRLGTLVPKLRSALQFEMEELYTTLVEPRVQALLAEVLPELVYALDEAAYARAEDENRIVQRLQTHLDALPPGYRALLTEANYALLFLHTLDAILAPLERAVLATRFTELGALRFDKDVRAMLALVTADAPWGARDRFVRLQQIAFVLNRDDDEDAYEAGTALGISWQLTPNEVQHVRGLALR